MESFLDHPAYDFGIAGMAIGAVIVLWKKLWVQDDHCEQLVGELRLKLESEIEARAKLEGRVEEMSRSNHR